MANLNEELISNDERETSTVDDKSRKRHNSTKRHNSRKWQNLHADILQKIFSHVPFSDLHDKIANVCRSWRAACWHTAFPLSETGDVNESRRLLRLLETIMKKSDGYDCSVEEWRSSIHTVDIPYEVEICDEDLVYIAEKTSGVRNFIHLWNCGKMTTQGFARAIRSWKNFKCLHMERVRLEYASKFVKEISRICSCTDEIHVWLSSGLMDRRDVAGITKRIIEEVKLQDVNFSICNGGDVVFFTGKPLKSYVHEVSESWNRLAHIYDDQYLSEIEDSLNITLYYFILDKEC